MAFKFEELRIGHSALDMSNAVHELTLTFPKDELFILTSQTKRAADSIALNIAEGSTGQSNKEFSRFLGIALRSAIEVVACLHIANRRGYIDEKRLAEFKEALENLTISIQSLRKKLNEE